jgi:excisionase family DNA binding protein
MYAMMMEQELTIEDVAKRLGISYRTAYKRIVEQRLIRARREGPAWRVRESDLQRYIESTYPDDRQEEK